MTGPAGMGAGQAFIDRSRAYLSSEYLPKIRRCLDLMGEDDLWWRPNPQSNSVGNLVLHLAGNIRQWVISGVGDAPDDRRRQEEFDKTAAGRGELVELLESTLREVDRVLSGLDPELLLSRRVIQGRDVTVLEAVYHAVEHFSMHTGQIIYITKQRTGTDLAFYDFDGGTARRTW